MATLPNWELKITYSPITTPPGLDSGMAELPCKGESIMKFTILMQKIRGYLSARSTKYHRKYYNIFSEKIKRIFPIRRLNMIYTMIFREEKLRTESIFLQEMAGQKLSYILLTNTIRKSEMKSERKILILLCHLAKVARDSILAC